jgi:hypothetical protein
MQQKVARHFEPFTLEFRAAQCNACKLYAFELWKTRTGFFFISEYFVVSPALPSHLWMQQKGARPF